MLIKKMLRDMKHNKTQFISIFLMAFLGVFIYAVVGGEWYGLQQTSNKYYQDTNLADVWIYGNNFSEKEVEAVSKVDGVSQVQRRLSLEAVAVLDNSPSVTLHFIEKNNISKTYRVTGEDFSAQKDGIWLDDQFAGARHLKTGDTVAVTAFGVKLEKKILGTVLSPEYVYSTGGNDIVPNHANYGFAYLPVSAFPKQMKMVYTELLITTGKTPDALLEDRINSALNGHYSVYLDRDNFGSCSVL